MYYIRVVTRRVFEQILICVNFSCNIYIISKQQYKRIYNRKEDNNNTIVQVNDIVNKIVK